MGENSTTRFVIGGILGTYPECTASLWVDDCNSVMFVLGMGALFGFRIWETVDLWAAPPSQNRRICAIKAS